MVYHQRMIEALPLCWLAAVSLSAVRAEPAPLPPPSAHPVDFIQDVQPILASTCLSCHGPEKQRADYRLDVKSTALTGGADHAPNIIPGNSAESPLIQFVASLDPDQRMPPKKDPLTPTQIGILRRWIDDGASWPEAASAAVPDKTDWWSLRPLVKSTAPAMPEGGRNAVDAFIAATLKTKNLSLSSEADARTLCRRLYFDLTGLPPSPEEVEQFVRRCQSQTGPDAAWQELVDTLLASPRYGERWARHWLDVVHFGETHGFDKDQPRPHAWPYRDYVIRSFNADKPYSRFVQEQIAGDILFPGTVDGITALGFIAAGPWDLIGHAEVGEEKIDGKIARHLDRDDMVANTLNTFSAMTVHCAQCHDHKFDPISADDYYSLQSVFAAVDRADRPYDEDQAVATRRASLQARQRDLQSQTDRLMKLARDRGGETLKALEALIASLDHPTAGRTQGWHSNLEEVQNTTKWVQIDLGTSTDLKQIILHPCHDNYNQIGDGFGFPLRFKVEISDDASFEKGVTVIADQSAQDFTNPGIKPVAFDTHGSARHVRLTATTLASRRDAFIFALAEVHVLDGTGKNVAERAPVTALDSIEAPHSWSRDYLTDTRYPAENEAGATATRPDRAKLTQARQLVIAGLLGEKEASDLNAAEISLQEANEELKNSRLPSSFMPAPSTTAAPHSPAPAPAAENPAPSPYSPAAMCAAQENPLNPEPSAASPHCPHASISAPKRPKANAAPPWPAGSPTPDTRSPGAPSSTASGITTSAADWSTPPTTSAAWADCPLIRNCWIGWPPLSAMT
jgi:mono/diheme cytochrome c family protein